MKKINLNFNSFLFIFQLLLLVLHNNSFFESISTKSYQGNTSQFFILFNLICLAFIVNTIATTIFFWKQTHKIALFTFLSLNSIASFYMKEYGVRMNLSIIEAIFTTTTKEAKEFFSFDLFKHYVLFSLLPFLVINTFIRVQYKTFIKKLTSKILNISLMLILVGIFSIFSYNSVKIFTASNRNIAYPVPISYMASFVRYVKNINLKELRTPKVNISKGSVHKIKDNDKPYLFVVVIGESARADRFQLNGYNRETNPNLSKLSIVNFTNAYSCGTSTATSVPCIFSHLSRKEYINSRKNKYENLIDIAAYLDFKVLWNENGSRDYGVVNKKNSNIRYYKTQILTNKNYCNNECHDEILIRHKVKEFITENRTKNIVLVLHQMGSHGPAYHLRKPKEFEKFTPECKSVEPKNCSKEELNNSYDNTIYYTDHVINETIKFLQSYSTEYKTGLIYTSDHGESLGENEIYFHGRSYNTAPKAQKHVPMFFWLDKSFEEKAKNLKKNQNQEVSHDNIFHTILGLLDIQNPHYKQELDLTK